MLLLAVDDATGKVVSALFCEYENTRDYFRADAGTDRAPTGYPSRCTPTATRSSSMYRGVDYRALQPSSPVRWTSSEYR